MFNLNGDEWRVLLVSSTHPMLHRVTGGWTLGACSNNNKTIYIREDLDDEKLKKVLCHEITHASMFSYHVSLSSDQEELLADLLASYGPEIIQHTNHIFNAIKKRGI